MYDHRTLESPFVSVLCRSTPVTRQMTPRRIPIVMTNPPNLSLGEPMHDGVSCQRSELRTVRCYQSIEEWLPLSSGPYS